MTRLIEQQPGHHVDVQSLDEVVSVLTCECGWGPLPVHVTEVDERTQLHWAAKICEREALDDLEDEIRDAVQSLNAMSGTAWIEELGRATRQ